MKNKLYVILLLIAFTTAILQPAVPFVQYFLHKNVTVIDDDCNCNCETTYDPTHPPTSDAYLKALLKRACTDKKKNEPKLPVVSISVFIKTLYSPKSQVYTCPEYNFNKISDFIVIPPTSSHIEELFRPPRLS